MSGGYLLMRAIAQHMRASRSNLCDQSLSCNARPDPLVPGNVLVMIYPIKGCAFITGKFELLPPPKM